MYELLHITSPKEDEIISTNHTILTGVHRPNSPVILSIHGKIYQVLSDKSGEFTLALENLPIGKNTISLVSGLNTSKFSHSFYVSSIFITSPTVNEVLYEAESEITGKTFPNTQVHILVDQSQEFSTKSNASGDFSVKVPILPGKHTVRAQIVDPNNGGKNIFSDSIAFYGAFVEISSPVQDEEVTTEDIVISGTTTPNTLIQIEENGSLLTKITSDINGSFSASITNIENGPHNFLAFVLDKTEAKTSFSSSVVFTKNTPPKDKNPGNSG